MATVIVVDDVTGEERLRESVGVVHLSDEHTSLQIIQRIAWAVEDADGALVPHGYRASRAPHLTVV